MHDMNDDDELLVYQHLLSSALDNIKLLSNQVKQSEPRRLLLHEWSQSIVIPDDERIGDIHLLIEITAKIRLAYINWLHTLNNEPFEETFNGSQTKTKEDPSEHVIHSPLNPSSTESTIVSASSGLGQRSSVSQLDDKLDSSHQLHPDPVTSNDDDVQQTPVATTTHTNAVSSTSPVDQQARQQSSTSKKINTHHVSDTKASSPVVDDEKLSLPALPSSQISPITPSDLLLDVYHFPFVYSAQDPTINETNIGTNTSYNHVLTRSSHPRNPSLTFIVSPNNGLSESLLEKRDAVFGTGLSTSAIRFVDLLNMYNLAAENVPIKTNPTNAFRADHVYVDSNNLRIFLKHCQSALGIKSEEHYAEDWIVDATDKVICIGDIHGGLQGLLVLVQRLIDGNILDPTTGHVTSGYRIVFLGDLTDRGYASIPVMLLAYSLWADNSNTVRIIRGNHESANLDLWKRYGLREQVVSRLQSADGFSGFSEIEGILVQVCKLSPCFIRLQHQGRKETVLLCHGGPSELLSLPPVSTDRVFAISREQATVIMWTDFAWDMTEKQKSDALWQGRPTLRQYRNEPQAALSEMSCSFVVRGHQDTIDNAMLFAKSGHVSLTTHDAESLDSLSEHGWVRWMSDASRQGFKSRVNVTACSHHMDRLPFAPALTTSSNTGFGRDLTGVAFVMIHSTSTVIDYEKVQERMTPAASTLFNSVIMIKGDGVILRRRPINRTANLDNPELDLDSNVFLQSGTHQPVCVANGTSVKVLKRKVPSEDVPATDTTYAFIELLSGLKGYVKDSYIK